MWVIFFMLTCPFRHILLLQVGANQNQTMCLDVEGEDNGKY